MIASLHRILIIGRNTLTEAVRQKVLNVLLIFAVVLVCASSVLLDPESASRDSSSRSSS